MQRRWVKVLIGLGVVAAVVAAGLWAVIFLRDSDSASDCVVPAVEGGAAVTVQVEGPQTSGAGAAGTAEANASPSASSTITEAGQVDLSAVQLQHASTINAVGLARGTAERARIIAVATAWQESRLRNLPAGDRDSVGLFQQRPSQGWGTPAQLQDPVFAATAFYNALEQVSGWQDMSLTAAAQAVQYSAYPDAYAQWEPSATTLVRSLSGERVTLTCPAGAIAADPLLVSRDLPTEAAAAGPGLRSLLAALTAELGAPAAISINADGTVATVDVGSAEQARIVAAWAVAHSTGTGLTDLQLETRWYRDHHWSDVADHSWPAGQVVLTATP